MLVLKVPAIILRGAGRVLANVAVSIGELRRGEAQFDRIAASAEARAKELGGRPGRAELRE